MPLGNCPDTTVERGNAGEDVASGLHQGLEDRHEVRGDRQPAFDDLRGPALEPADPLSEHDAKGLQQPLISFSSLTRMPTKASRAVSIARLT